MELVVVGVDAPEAARALAAAQAEIRRLDEALSGWRPDSELARLNSSTGPMAVSRDLFHVVELCERLRTDCGGAFSARIGKVEAIWRAAAQSGRLSDIDAPARAGREAQTARVILDPEARSIDRGGVVLAVDALAKGYIVDAALDAAARAAPHVSGVMLNIGGDLRCRGAAPGASAWSIGLAEGPGADNIAPTKVLHVRDQAVATSGPGARDLAISGVDLNHTIDPRSGQPAPRRTVTVVAGSTAIADGLATALGVSPIADGLALTDRFAAHARIVEADGAVWTTAGWDAMIGSSAGTDVGRGGRPGFIQAANPSNVAPWPSGYQVGIGYEIAYAPAVEYFNPFVAIWISDAQGRVVRTLFHLGNRPRRYLNSNYVWWSGFNGDGHGPDKLESVTRPTRRPGRYTVVWDGRDDKGVLVGQGRYVVNIEMTREHGGHSLQTLPLDLGQTPVTATVSGQGESGAATARYGRPAA